MDYNSQISNKLIESLLKHNKFYDLLEHYNDIFVIDKIKKILFNPVIQKFMTDKDLLKILKVYLKDFIINDYETIIFIKEHIINNDSLMKKLSEK